MAISPGVNCAISYAAIKQEVIMKSVDREEMRRFLDAVTICQECGQQKTHYRQYGYLCRNPEHNKDVEKYWRHSDLYADPA